MSSYYPAGVTSAHPHFWPDTSCAVEGCERDAEDGIEINEQWYCDLHAMHCPRCGKETLEIDMYGIAGSYRCATCEEERNG